MGSRRNVGTHDTLFLTERYMAGIFGPSCPEPNGTDSLLDIVWVVLALCKESGILRIYAKVGGGRGGSETVASPANRASFDAAEIRPTRALNREGEFCARDVSRARRERL